jgi:2'-5' RNA ligase
MDASLKTCMARVFSAVDIEDEEVLNKLEKIRDRLDLGFSPVKKENMHLTLKFFEEIEEQQIADVESAMSNVDVEPFKMELKGLGAFPSEDYIRVVWAGVNSHEVFNLHKQVKLHDVSSDNKHEFKPHITLLRVKDVSKQRKKKLKRVLGEHRDESFGKVNVNSLKLFESMKTGNGSKYRKISEFDL